MTVIYKYAERLRETGSILDRKITCKTQMH